jgi:hypothetical protein
MSGTGTLDAFVKRPAQAPAAAIKSAMFKKALLAPVSAAGDDLATAIKDGDLKGIAKAFMNFKNNDAQSCITLLKGVAKHMEDAEVERTISSQQNEPVLCTVKQVSLQNPRGKFDMQFREKSMLLLRSNGKESLLLQYADINFMWSLPEPHKKNHRFLAISAEAAEKTDKSKGTKKIEKQYLLVFAPDQGKQTHQIDFTPTGAAKPEKIVGTGLQVFTQLLPQVTGQVMRQESKLAFASSKNLPFLKCYKKSSDGVLFPLPEGLIFIKPFTFIPRSQIAGLSTAKVGTGRTFNFTVACDEGFNDVEFRWEYWFELPCVCIHVACCSMLESEELNATAAYTQWVLRKATKEAQAEDRDEKSKLKTEASGEAMDGIVKSEGKNESTNLESSASAKDSPVATDASTAGGGKRQRSQRSSAVVANSSFGKSDGANGADDDDDDDDDDSDDEDDEFDDDEEHQSDVDEALSGEEAESDDEEDGDFDDEDDTNRSADTSAAGNQTESDEEAGPEAKRARTE